MKLAAMGLRQRDGTTCGPAVAVVAGALLDPSYAGHLTRSDGRAWFTAEQGRVHAAVNRIWPQAIGMTPWAMAAAISTHSARRYAWRLLRRGDALAAALADVERAVTSGWPVAMLVGGRLPLGIPRHWVLIVECQGDALGCYEPSSGEVRPVAMEDVRRGCLTGLGYPRAHAVVLPRYCPPGDQSNI